MRQLNRRTEKSRKEREEEGEGVGKGREGGRVVGGREERKEG